MLGNIDGFPDRNPPIWLIWFMVSLKGRIKRQVCSCCQVEQGSQIPIKELFPDPECENCFGYGLPPIPISEFDYYGPSNT